jgi:hypothetical protein
MFADNALRFRVQKISSSYPVPKSEACLPTYDRPCLLSFSTFLFSFPLTSRVGGGSNICRASYCATTTVPDDLATYAIYFFHNKSTLDLRVSFFLSP